MYVEIWSRQAKHDGNWFYSYGPVFTRILFISPPLSLPLFRSLTHLLIRSRLLNLFIYSFLSFFLDIEHYFQLLKVRETRVVTSLGFSFTFVVISVVALVAVLSGEGEDGSGDIALTLE